MKKVYFLFCLMVAGFVTKTNVNAQIAAWEFLTAAGNEATVAATTLNANLAATSVSRGAGLNASLLGNSFSSTNFTAAGDFTDAVTNNKYIQFTIAAAPTYRTSLSTLDVNFRRSSTGPNAFQWQYSLDGFTTAGVNIGGAISFTNTATAGIAQTQIDLSVIPALQNVANPAVITFRLYGWGATANTGTFALGRPTTPLNDLAIDGTVAAAGSSATLADITQPTGNILQGATDVVLAGFSITPTVSADFTAMTIDAAGTATGADITNVRIFRDNDGNGAINGADAEVTGPGAQAYAAAMNFAGITSETGLTGITYYLVVADVAGAAVPGNTTTVSSNTFTTTATTNTGTFTGEERIIAAPPGASTITAGAGAEPATISSLINTQGASVLNFDFVITDDGVTPGTDAIATQISEIILNAGIGNAVTDWVAAIAGAELSDGTNTTTAATIGTGSITFSGIANNIGELGYIADNAAKTYTLRIWLNTNLGALNTVIDGQDFVFRIQTADVTSTGSQLATGQDENSGDGNNTVDVAATELAFVAQPTNTLVNTGMANVTVSANDVNNNRDLDFVALVDITSSGTLAASPITVAAVAGLVTFPGITHTAPGIGLTLNAERNGTLDWDVLSGTFDITTITTYTWNGGNGLWTVAANWTPVRTTPDPSDILLFNDGTPAIVTDVPTQTIGNLLISGNTAVSLQSPAAATLTIGGGAGTDLDVELGSELNATGTSALSIILATGATGSVTGNMTFSGAAHKFDGADASAVTFNSPAVFTQDAGCTGNVFTNGGTASVMQFTAGTLFQQNAGSNPFGLGQPLSKVIFQTGSLFRIGQNAAPSFSGRTYANLEIDFATFSQSGAGANPLAIDTLTVTQGTLNINITTGGVSIKGDINVAAGQTLTFSPATASTLTLDGTVPQRINNAGTFSFGANESLTINNAAGVTVNTNITLGAPATLTLTSGIVRLTPAATVLTLSAGTSLAGVSNASYVDGKVRKVGNTNFTFPVGKTGFGYVPIGISGFVGGAATDDFTAEYRRGSARLLGPVTTPSIDHVSGCDYWTLDLNNGTPTVDVTGYWSTNNVCNGTYIDVLAEVEMAHFDGANWSSSSFGSSIKNGTIVTGDVTWPAVSTFSPFALASSSVNNPLPISINYFNGVKSNGNHILNWKVTCVSTPATTIELERSVDGTNFSSIYSIYATALRCAQPFDFTDNAPVKGINYYRLKMTDASGKVSYSSQVPLINSSKGIDIMSIAPNPVVGGRFNIRASTASSTKLNIIISDLQGRIMQRQQVNAIAGYNTIPVNVQNLSGGTYQVLVNTAEGDSKLLRFVIQ